MLPGAYGFSGAENPADMDMQIVQIEGKAVQEDEEAGRTHFFSRRTLSMLSFNFQSSKMNFHGLRPSYDPLQQNHHKGVAVVFLKSLK